MKIAELNKCGLPQGSILGPLPCLLYVNDLKNVSSVLDSIIFADDTNFSYTDSNIQKLFSKVNEELASTNKCFFSKKLSLNANKTKHCFSINPRKRIISFLY